MAFPIPFPNMDFVPLDVLTAAEQNQIAANIDFLAGASVAKYSAGATITLPAGVWVVIQSVIAKQVAPASPAVLIYNVSNTTIAETWALGGNSTGQNAFLKLTATAIVTLATTTTLARNILTQTNSAIDAENFIAIKVAGTI